MNGGTVAAQRGVVVSITKKFLVVKSANGALHRWRLSGATRFRDVAGTATGMTTLTGSKAKTFQYLISGGDEALLLSDELPGMHLLPFTDDYCFASTVPWLV